MQRERDAASGGFVATFPLPHHRAYSGIEPYPLEIVPLALATQGRGGRAVRADAAGATRWVRSFRRQERRECARQQRDGLTVFSGAMTSPHVGRDSLERAHLLESDLARIV